MISIGITGGIGAGKSVTASMLRRLGFPLIDTDDIARSLVEPGQPAFQEVVSAFGPKVVDVDGGINRAALAEIIFPDATSRQILEGILHPRIRERWTRWLVERREHGDPAGFVIVPLLYEKEYGGDFDSVVSVSCSRPEQVKRLAARGWTAGEIERRIDAQLPMYEKIRRANFVVWNDGSLETLEAQWHRILPILWAGPTGN